MKMHTLIKGIHDNAWVFSLIILIGILVTIPFTIIAVQNKTTDNTQASTLACTPYPTCYYASTNKCVLPAKPSATSTWCLPTPVAQSCGTIIVQGNTTAVTASTQNAETCFWNAYEACNATGQSNGTTLNVVANTNDAMTTTTYTTKLTTLNGVTTCSIGYTTANTSTCSGLTYSSQTGMQFSDCDNTGNITIPPASSLVTPTPLPTPACTPRPSCLDAKPACQIAMPANGWCPTAPTPILTPKTCQSAADCGLNQICVAPGPIQVNPTTGETVSIKYCYDKDTAIPL